MKLLLIMPNFFDYPRVIIEELQRMGYEVDFYDDRPSTNAWIKAIIRINRNWLTKYIEAYFQQMLKEIGDKKYDVVFLISGQSLSFDENMIAKLKELQSNAKFLLYQWDSLVNFPYIKQMQKYFDKCYSFDEADVKENCYLQFLPLFYSKEYEQIGKEVGNEYKYDLCFVGTAHPKKYKFIKLMSEELKQIFPRQFVYFFYPSRLVYIYRKIFNVELKKARYDEFHFVGLKRDEINKLFAESKCVIDSAQDGQNGLTIRVIEALGAKKKIITTNSNIKRYDFYKAENIYVYEDKLDLSDKFFQVPYSEVEEEIYEKYSLRNWLVTMLKED